MNLVSAETLLLLEVVVYGKLKKGLAKGCRWRIENGRTTSTWEDHSLPDHSSLIWENMSISGERKEDHQTKWWNAKNVRALFNPIIASKVLKIFIVPNEQPDKYIWTQAKSESFSVRSAYRMFKVFQGDNMGEYSNAGRQHA